MTPNPPYEDDASPQNSEARPPAFTPPFTDGSRATGPTGHGEGRGVRWEQDEALVRALFAQSRIGLAIHDNDLQVVRASLGESCSPGPEVDDRKRFSLHELLVDEDATAIEGTLREVSETGESLIEVPHRARLRTRPDTERMVSLSVLPLTDADGSRMGVASAYTDITGHYRAEQGRSLVNDAAQRLAASLDVTRCAEEVTSLLVPRFADMAAVDVTEAVLAGDEPGELRRGAPLRRTAVGSPAGGWPEELHQRGMQIRVRTCETERLRRSTHVLVRDMTAMRDSFADDADRSRLLLPRDAASFVAVPLRARGHVLGAVSLWRTRGQHVPFDRQDAELAEEIVSRAALSMDNARRYTRERRTAETLRRGLLPPAHVRVAATYAAGVSVPAATTSGVGGTWLDVVPLPSARVAFVVGDTAGHGLHATAATGRLRTAVRTLTDMDLPPEELLTHLHDVVPRLAAEDAQEPAAETGPVDAAGLTGSTCLYAVYDPVTGSCVIASAGHPPPVVIDPGGEAHVVEDVTGPRLAESGVPFEPIALSLDRGSHLAFSSGNLVAGPEPGGISEARTEELRTELAAAVRQHGSPAAIARATLTAMVPDPPDEDVSLLVARTHRLSPASTAYWEFPAEPASVAEAREAVTTQLADWDLEEMAFTTELAASELVTNAIRYAGDPVRLRLIKDSTLICEVSDPSQTQPRLRRARLNDEGGRGLFLVHQITDRWGSRYTSGGKTIWTEQSLPEGG